MGFQLLYFNSDEIVKDDIVWGLLELEIDVQRPEYKIHLHEYNEEEIDTMCKLIHNCAGVITQNFSVMAAEACYREKVKYISWVYDSPQRALYLPEAKYDTNFIFVFDKKQRDRLKEFGIVNVFYCPLAANISKAGMLEISDADLIRYGADCSFVGQLYHKDYYQDYINRAPVDIKKELNRIIADSCFRWNKGDSVFHQMDKKLMENLRQEINVDDLKQYQMPVDYVIDMLMVIPQVASLERKRILEEISQDINTKLYTKLGDQMDTECGKTIICPPVNMENEMFKVFYSSKINLNLTMRSIESGVPQRVFDIMAVGGFVLSNYQEEAEELFIPDKEIVLAHSKEEMIDKAKYYLKHEDDRIKIGINGYQKVKRCYTYPILLEKIMNIVYE